MAELVNSCRILLVSGGLSQVTDRAYYSNYRAFRHLEDSYMVTCTTGPILLHTDLFRLFDYYFVDGLIVVFVCYSDRNYLFARRWTVDRQMLLFFGRIRQLVDWLNQQPLAAVDGILGLVDITAG